MGTLHLFWNPNLPQHQVSFCVPIPSSNRSDRWPILCSRDPWCDPRIVVRHSSRLESSVRTQIQEHQSYPKIQAIWVPVCRSIGFVTHIDPLLQDFFAWSIIVFLHEITENAQCLFWRLLQFHVNKVLGIIVQMSHLNGVQEFAKAENLTENTRWPNEISFFLKLIGSLCWMHINRFQNKFQLKTHAENTILTCRKYI